jgi:hypothetical protein
VISLGLNSADLKLFNQSLATHHSVRITVQLLSLNHAYLADLSDQLLDGQVSIDSTAEVTRSLTIELFDPDHTLKIDSTAPADGALFYDRMIRVVYSVKSEILPRWVDVPIFCGPITKMVRNVDKINVECQGKESLLIPPAVSNKSHVFGKGWKRSSLVRTLMGGYGGETKFSIPDYGAATAGPVTMTSESNIWQLAKSVNGSFATRQLFYDGRGVLVMRNTPQTSTYTFSTGPGGTVTTTPTIDYDISSVRNVVKVKGAIPKGKKTPVTAQVGLPRTHPMNHVNMGRTGASRVLLEVITDDNIKTTAQAVALAKARVNSLAYQYVDIKFDALVAPHLEPLDIYTLKTPDFSMSARINTMTIPLRSAVGAVGHLVRKNANKGRIRR